MKRFVKKLIVCVCLVAIVGGAFAVSGDEVAKITSAAPGKASVSPKKARKVLVFTLCKGYKHGSIPYCSKAMEVLGSKTGAFTCDVTADMSVFTAENLAQYDAIIFNNSTKLTFDDAQRKALMGFVKGGKGIVGIHAATDNFYKWPEAAEMMGGTFSGHPWRAKGTWAVKIEDADSSVTAAFEGKDFKINDEIYRTKQINLRKNGRVLIGLDMTDETNLNAKGVTPEDVDIPVSWIRDFGKGRVFYCGLGHNKEILWNPAILRHYLDGIQFAIGDLDADTTPLAFGEKPSGAADIKAMLDAVSGYKYGQSRKGLTNIEKAIKDSLDSAAKLLEIEIAMGHFLVTDATGASKQFVCRQLGLIGTGASAGILGQMLVKDETSDMARYALERIGGSEVDSVLLDGLGETKGKARIGIINSIGVRRMNSAVDALSELASDGDKETVAAAINSLGQIGSVEAAKTLDGMIRKGGVLAEDAYLRCADQLAGDGKKKEARRIYKKVRRKSSDASIKVAVLRGLVHVSKDPSDLIISTIDSKDPALQVQAISMVSMIKGSSDIKKAAGKIKGLPVRGQVQLLFALVDTGDAVILPVVLESVKSSELEVRIAAIKALKSVGNPASVGVLAGIAANTKGEEQRTARASLYDLAATGTDEAILASFKGADAGVKIELLKAVVERKIANSKPVLSKGIQDRDAKVRMEALRAVSVTQNLQLVKLRAALTKAVTDSERLLAANTIVVVVNAKDDTTEDARQIVELMPYFKKKGGVDVTAAVLRVLGGIGNDVGYDTLVKAISSKDEKIQRAAIDGLSVWPDGKPAEVLMASVSNALNESNKVMAFRGLVAQLGKVKGNKSAHLYAEAMKIAPNDGEKRKVLSAMTVKPCTQTLDLGLVYIEDSKLKKEAVTAVSQILTNFTDPLNEKTLSALRKAKTMAGNDAISKRFLDLSGDDLSVWAKPLGKWEVVGKTTKSTENEKKLVAEEGTGIIYNGPDGKTNNLLSAEEHGDVTAHIEFMVPKGSNSGVYFMGRYEIQVLDSYGVEDKKLKHAHCGGIYQRWKDGKGFEGRRPDVNASKPAGQWQSFDVVFKAPRFNRRGRKQANAKFVKVVHNGIVIHENQEVTGMTRSGMSEKEVPTGPLMLQGDHGPVAYRNIYLIKN